MRRPPQLLSAQGEKVIIAGMPAVLLSVLTVGFAALGAPLATLAVSVALILLCIVAVRNDLQHVRRYGWSAGSDGPNRDGRGSGPDEPISPRPSGDGDEFDWAAFEVEFREHAEREPVA